MATQADNALHLGACSWKYPSWRGLVYSDAANPNYLQEYAQHFDTVEIDQWFWSLFGSDKVILPQPKVVAEYAAAVPEGFRFGVKMPNALTLTHYHQKAKTDPLVPNPHFLSMELLRTFLDRLGAFVNELPAGYTWAVETRNPNHLNPVHFGFLREHGLANVFQQGYYMPPVPDVYGKYADRLTENVIIRLHGKDREGMEERAGKDWSRILEPRDADLDALARMVRDLKKRGRKAWAFVNNHFEGCAPLTIERIKGLLGSGGS